MCREINGTILAESQCEHIKKPADSVSCTGASCGEWKVFNWSSVMNISANNARKAKRIYEAFLFGDFVNFFQNFQIFQGK